MRSTRGYLFAGILLWMLLEIIFRAYQSFFIPLWVFTYMAGFLIADAVENRNVSWYTIFKYVLPFCIVLNTWRIACQYVMQIGTDGSRGNMLLWSYNVAQFSLAITLFAGLFIISDKLLKHYVQKGFCKKVLDFSDKYSYDCYIAHMIYVKGALSVMEMTSIPVLNVLLAIVLTIISGIVLYWCGKVLEKMFRRVIRCAK